MADGYSLADLEAWMAYREATGEDISFDDWVAEGKPTATGETLAKGEVAEGETPAPKPKQKRTEEDPIFLPYRNKITDWLNFRLRKGEISSAEKKEVYDYALKLYTSGEKDVWELPFQSEIAAWFKSQPSAKQKWIEKNKEKLYFEDLERLIVGWENAGYITEIDRKNTWETAKRLLYEEGRAVEDLPYYWDAIDYGEKTREYEETERGKKISHAQRMEEARIGYERAMARGEELGYIPAEAELGFIPDMAEYEERVDALRRQWETPRGREILASRAEQERRAGAGEPTAPEETYLPFLKGLTLPSTAEEYFERQLPDIWQKFGKEGAEARTAWWEREKGVKPRFTTSIVDYYDPRIGLASRRQFELPEDVIPRNWAPVPEETLQKEYVGEDPFAKYLKQYPFLQEWYGKAPRERGVYPSRYRPPTRYL